ncbi:MAG: DUF4118 domain-containing protein [Kofleriaceae bacterium]
MLTERGPWRYAWAALAIAAVTTIGLVLYPHLTLADMTMVYLIAIMLASLAGRGPSLVAASLAVVTYDVCFVEPRYRLAVSDVHHVLTFAVMFGCGLAISTLTERLRRQKQEAIDAALRAHTEELRSSLLSAVSHDLRTPLAVITGAATSLRDDAPRLSDAARAELLSTIIDDARRLEQVLANVLQLTRVEGGFAPSRDWVPAEEVVGAALTRLEPLLDGCQVEVEVESELLLWIDPVLFEQVLLNLVDNAVKHGNPPVTIRAHRAGGHAVIVVEDRGRGLPADPARLFEKFVHESPAPGVGLGLAVVRAIVIAHGGTVVAERGTAGGARFEARIPAGSPPAFVNPPVAIAEAGR